MLVARKVFTANIRDKPLQTGVSCQLVGQVQLNPTVGELFLPEKVTDNKLSTKLSSTYE